MGLGKLMRTLRREYPARTAVGVPIGAAVAGGVAAVAVVGTAAAPFLLGATIAAPVVYYLLGSEDNPCKENETHVNGYRLVGEPKDLNRIRRTQKLIDNWTRRLFHRPDLPEKLRVKILRHVEDAAESLSRVRVYNKMGGDAEEKSFSFTRSYYGEGGKEKTHVIAVVDLVPPAGYEPTQLPVLINAHNPRQLPAPKTLQIGFEQVRDRLSAIEMEKPAQPAPAVTTPKKEI